MSLENTCDEVEIFMMPNLAARSNNRVVNLAAIGNNPIFVDIRVLLSTRDE